MQHVIARAHIGDILLRFDSAIYRARLLFDVRPAGHLRLDHRKSLFAIARFVRERS